MSENEQATGTGLDRRRFIKGAGAGAAIAWAAPTITGLDPRALAQGSPAACITSLSDNFNGESTTPDSGGYSNQSELINFAVTQGNVDVIGYGSDAASYNYYGGSEGLYIDLLGTGGGPATELTSKQDFCEGRYTVTLRYSPDPRFATGTITASLGSGSATTGPVGSGPADSIPLTFGATVPSGGGKLVINATSSDGNNGPLLLEVTVS